jgi:hypothetical protein
MFDLTKKIKLEPELYKKYKMARFVLHFVFLIGVFFVANRILFPSLPLDFSFANANSLKNTLVSPRLNNLTFPEKGSVSAQNKFIFNANPIGNFSDAIITFTTDKNSKNIANTSITMRKSYTAFFFPEGTPIGFKNGTLLNNIFDDSYYIVSNGVLRKFSDRVMISKLGYAKNSFLPVSSADLTYNEIGKDIVDTNTYPDDTLFIIDDIYYQMKNQQLSPFVSTRAFLSQYETNQAIVKNNDFLANQTVSETYLGFADGTLASFDVSAFILSGNKSYPIINADTFVRMGFNWKDVVALDPEELGLYEKQKSFTRDQSHPDGTLFLDQKTKTYFVIKDGQRHPIKSSVIEKTYSKQNPVLANSEESGISATCTLKKNLLSFNTYSCIIPIGTLNSFL